MALYQAENSKCKNIMPAIDLSRKYYEMIYKGKHISLSKRQSECLYHLLHGRTSYETAKILSISTRTVEIYLSQIRGKTHCARKQEILKYINIIQFIKEYPWANIQ